LGRYSGTAISTQRVDRDTPDRRRRKISVFTRSKATKFASRPWSTKTESSSRKWCPGRPWTTKTDSRCLENENGVLVGPGARKQCPGLQTDSRSALDHENEIQVGLGTQKWSPGQPWMKKTESRSALGRINSVRVGPGARKHSAGWPRNTNQVGPGPRKQNPCRPWSS
jgi:hypothetical protein